MNVKAGHTKGHQLKTGQVIAVGEYQCSFKPDSYRDTFRADIYTILVSLLEKLQSKTQSSKHLEEQEAANIHRDSVLRNFFQHLNVGQSTSSVTQHASRASYRLQSTLCHVGTSCVRRVSKLSVWHVGERSST